MKTDIHSHIIFGIDDGSKTLEESCRIAQNLEKIGYTDIICTPHYIVGTNYCAHNKKKSENLSTLQNELDRKGIKIKLRLGNEVFIDENIIDNIKKQEIYPINNEYLLFEIPFQTYPAYLSKFIRQLQSENYIPILAHVERYSYFQKNPKKLKELHKTGVYFQGNYGSIVGLYGKETKKTLIYMLKNNLIDFLGTDIHHENSKIFNTYKKSERKIIRKIGKKKYREIIENSNILAK